MVNWCCCYGCKEKYVKGGTVTFHSFPKDEERLKIWVHKIRRKNFVPSKYSKVCSKHFEEQCFDREKLGGVWLKEDAVPTIFNFPQHLLPKVPTRKARSKRTLPGLHTEETSSLHPEPLAECSEISAQNQEQHMEHVEGENVPPDTMISTSASRKRRYSYLGDFTEEDMNSPTKAKKALCIARKQLATQKRKIDILRIQNARCRKQVTSLSSLLEELKEKTNLSDEVCHVLEASLPGPSKELVKRALCKEKGRYSPELRTFALTLQLYSSKAYNYVRDTFDLALPHEVTLRKWYNAVDGSPGFTSGAVTALKAKVAEASEKGQKVYCAIALCVPLFSVFLVPNLVLTVFFFLII